MKAINKEKKETAKERNS